MRGNKNTIRWWVVLGVLLVVYSVLAFALPFPKNAVFVVSYLFTLAAMGAQIYVIRTAFYRGEGVKSKFYGFPIAKIGVMYLVAQVVLSLMFMALGNLVPVWLPLVVYVVLLGAAVIGFVAADAVRDEVVRQDTKLVKDISVMRGLQASMHGLAMQCEDDTLRNAVEALTESLRYSDPVSSEALTKIEDELGDHLSQLRRAITAKDNGRAVALCKKAESILAERNRLCKLTKGQ